jgi:ATP-binding protein involved in chromosome partitioning
MEFREEILRKLGSVMHPEHRKDIVSLNMIESYSEDNEKIRVVLTLGRKKDPMASSVRKMTEIAIKDIVKDSRTVEVIVKEKEEAAKVQVSGLSKVKKFVAVASGKGGVGKSTVAVNLAVSLARKGYKTGLLDADIYGPSLPKMLGLEGFQPEIQQEEGRDMMVPPEKYGIKVMSIGFFFDASRALIWRGPMATSAIRNLLNDTLWGELDYLLIDLPPGTNDIHLTMVQTIGLNSAVIVTTPQMVAVADAVKAVNMFQNEQINVPVAGIVENMAWFSPSDNPEKKYFIFGKGGGQYMAETMKVPLLGHLPVNEEICSGGDSGNPSVLSESAHIAEDLEKITLRFLNEMKKIENVHTPHIVDVKHK